LPPARIGIAFYFLSNAIRVKRQFKKYSKTLKTMKEATKKNKHDIADGHENEAKSPSRNLEGRLICSLHKKF